MVCLTFSLSVRNKAVAEILATYLLGGGVFLLSRLMHLRSNFWSFHQLCWSRPPLWATVVRARMVPLFASCNRRDYRTARIDELREKFRQDHWAWTTWMFIDQSEMAEGHISLWGVWKWARNNWRAPFSCRGIIDNALGEHLEGGVFSHDNSINDELKLMLYLFLLLPPVLADVVFHCFYDSARRCCASRL